MHMHPPFCLHQNLHVLHLSMAFLKSMYPLHTHTRTHTHTHTQLYLYYQYLIAPPNNSQTMSQFMQPLAETLQLYISHSKYFIQDLESLPPNNATQIMFSLLFHIFYTTYPLGASYILSCHETDHSDSNSAPPQIIILQHLIPIPTLPPL